MTQLLTFPRTLFVIIKSLLLTALIVLSSLLLAITRIATRKRTDSMALYWAKGMLNTADIRRTRSTPLNLDIQPGRCYMVMCNHRSLYDIPLGFEALSGHSVRMLTKKELSYIPFFGQALKQNEFIYVDRHNRTRAIADLKAARKKMEDGIILWVAPEGTRSKTEELLPFKKGVFHLALDTEAIIIPMVIRGVQDVLPKYSINVQPGQDVHVMLGEPVDTKHLAITDKEVLLNKVRHDMLAMLDS